jgi:hypothetical protein
MAALDLEIICRSFPDVIAVMTINKSNKTWSEGEEENDQKVKKIFATKSGNWVFVSDSTITKLKNGAIQVGTLNDFDPSTAKPEDTGSGYSTEKELNFSWTVLKPTKSLKHVKKGA